MDIDKLRYFCTIVKTGSMTKASEILHISQPALSKAVKSLEEDFGEKLLIKVGRGLVPSNFGKKISDKASILIEEIMSLPDLKNTDDTSPIKIATFEVFSTYFLGEFISNSFSSHKVNILELVPGKIEEAILAGHADIGLTYLPVPNPNLDIIKVTSIHMGIFGVEKVFQNKKVENTDFVVPNIPITGSPSKARGLDGWPDHLFPRKIKYRVSIMESALDLCRRGKCVGYFPKFVIDIHNETVKKAFLLSELPLPKNLKSKKQAVYLVKSKSLDENIYFKALRDKLKLIS